jgi:hypothetical protein
MKKTIKQLGWWSTLFAFALATVILPLRATAQDQNDDQPQDDPPSRVARLGYMEGSVSFQPAGENDWVGAVENRPMTTGDKLWADKGSRAELQLGSAVIRLSENTGISFLNLDDHTIQVQLSSGAINVRAQRLDRDDAFEIDTPNLAFTLSQAGSYRLEASEDGSYSVVTIREGEGEATGNGQTYTLHNGQKGTFNGTDSLNADVEQVGDPDQFDNWAYNRDHRREQSRSAQYVSNDMVGYDDLDDNGDWRDDSNYGHVWYPHVEAGWAPYRDGHWDWIDPWGYTWVDDEPWGYAPFHYGRWASVGGRWGWISGPREERAVYAPALVVFVGGGGGFGGNVGWFPLGPREVFVPSYHVSREYVNRVNISNTTVNTTTVTNVYNTTVINRTTTNVTNVTYVNRNVQGAVTAVPQRAFASAQPVARAAVKMDAREIASAPVVHRVAVNPTRESVLGAKAASANHVTAPPAAVMNRQVIARKTPPPPPPPFAKQQQAMAAHPGQPLPKRELASLRPAAEAHPMVKVAPPGKPATPTTGHPNNQPANNGGRPGQPAAAAPANRPGQPPPGQPANQPANRPGNQPAPNERPGAANQPNNRPPENRPPAAQPNNRPPEANQPNNRPGQPANRPPEAAQPSNRPPEANQPNNRPGQPANRAAQPNNRPPAAEPNRPQPNQPGNRPPETNQPNNRPGQPANRPPDTNQPNNRPPAAEPNRAQPNQPSNRPAETNRPENRPPAAQPNNRPAQPENRPPAAQPNNRPAQPENRPPAAQPNNRPESARPENNRPAPAPTRNEPPPRQQTPPPTERPQQQHTPPPAAERQAPPPQHQQPKPQTPEEKKKQEEKKPPGV